VVKATVPGVGQNYRKVVHQSSGCLAESRNYPEGGSPYTILGMIQDYAAKWATAFQKRF
jgi:hypothetical protein